MYHHLNQPKKRVGVVEIGKKVRLKVNMGETGLTSKNAISPMHRNLLSNNNDAQSATKYGFPLWPNAHLVAPRTACELRLRRPPRLRAIQFFDVPQPTAATILRVQFCCWPRQGSSLFNPRSYCCTHVALLHGGLPVRVLPPPPWPLLTALEKPKPRSSPGLDGVSAEILMAFLGVLVPKMTKMIHMFVTDGKISEKWALAILAPIPKEKGSIFVTDLHPSMLTECFISMGVNGSLPHALRPHPTPPPPPEQKGFYSSVEAEV